MHSRRKPIAVLVGGVLLASACAQAPMPRGSSGHRFAPSETIAYVVWGPGADEIWTLNLDETGATRLLEGRDVAWSPDGSQIAFRQGNPNAPGGDPTEIYVANADGSNVRLVYEGQWAEPRGAGPPIWSPDGMRLAFAELDGIHVINGDGSGGRRISHYEGDHACYDLEPSWSPDGTGIAFAVRCEDGDLGIYLISPDGTERIRLTGMEGGTDTYASYFDAYPVWSPDGTRIAFTRVTGGPDYRYDLDVMNAEGTDVIRLIEGRLAPLAGITWSPDSSRIAFGDGQTGQVWLVGADGSDPRAVTDPTSSACCPAWRPE